MGFDSHIVERFAKLFPGRTDVYGVYSLPNVNQQPSTKKVTGSAVTQRGKVTADLWSQHLNGTKGLGIVPVIPPRSAHWGAIDIDVYGVDLSYIVRLVQDTPIVPCRSKSGGLHLFVFTTNKVSAAELREILRGFSKQLGYPKAEIFPKQEAIDTRKTGEEEELGSWINLPYFNAAKTNRYAYSGECEALPLEGFMALVEGKRCTLSKLKAVNLKRQMKKASVPEQVDDLAEAPPCLQHCIVHGFPEGTRNNGLLAVCVLYRKMYPEDWTQRLREANERLPKPLTKREVQVIINSAKKKDYNYRCKEAPIVDFCNRAVCLTRKYGVSNGGYAGVTQLIKVETMPPYYYAEVSGVTVGPIDVPTIYDNRRFQQLCFQYDLIIAPVKHHDWVQHLRTLMETMTLLPAPPDSGPVGQFWVMLREFCFTRFTVGNKEEVAIGRVYRKKNKFYFTTASLMDFLKRMQFTELSSGQITALMARSGLKTHQYLINGHSTHVWEIELEHAPEPVARKKIQNY